MLEPSAAAKPRPHAWQPHPVQWRGRGLRTASKPVMLVTRETFHEFTSELNASAFCSRQAMPARFQARPVQWRGRGLRTQNM